MKKSIAILSSLSLLSCNSDDNKECKCNASYYVENEGYTYPNVPMDCNTKEPLINMDEVLPKGYRLLTFSSCNFDK